MCPSVAGGGEEGKQTKSEQTKTKQTFHHKLAFNNGGGTREADNVICLFEVPTIDCALCSIEFLNP